MAKHRYKYKIYTTSGEHIKLSCYDIFDEYGIENCTIELVEYFSCETKDELFRREGEYIRNNDCVNKIIAGRTKQEYNAETKEKKRETDKLYYEKNKQAIQAKAKQYRDDNKEKKQQKHKEYYEKNKQKWADFYQQNKERLREERKDYFKQYRETNKDALKEKRKVYVEENRDELKRKKREYYYKNREALIEGMKAKILCECGCEITRKNMYRHQRTKKHQEALNNLNNINNVSLQTDNIREIGETTEREKV